MKLTAKEKKSGPRNEFWQDLIAQQERSGLAVRTFCSQHGVTEQSYYYWKKRLSHGSPVRFALVAADGTSFKHSAPLELELATGDRLRIGPGVDGATLRTVLEVLRHRA
jgi:transposase-like protein